LLSELIVYIILNLHVYGIVSLVSVTTFQDIMIVFGGLLVPSETFTDLLWSYNFTSDLWEVVSSSQGNNSISNNFTTSPDISMELNDTDYDYASGDNNNTNNTEDIAAWGLPLPVRGHTAHVIGNKMVVIFGLAYTAELFPTAIQQLDLGELFNMTLWVFKIDTLSIKLFVSCTSWFVYYF